MGTILEAHLCKRILGICPECFHAPARSGYTACGDFFASNGAQNQCQPGQYCADDTFSKCAQGCLSDVNCAGNQVCSKDPGMQIGICQNLDYYGSR